MAFSVTDMLRPEVILGVISQFRLINTTLQDFWGLRSGAAGREVSPLRNASVDVFNATREVGEGRLPETPAAVVKRQKIGTFNVTVPRKAEKILLSAEWLDHLRRLGGPTSANDKLGQDYVLRQLQFMAQKVANFREFQCAAMMRGKYYLSQSGDSLNHSLSSGDITVDFQIPSGNLTDLQMAGGAAVIGASWATAGTPIIDHCLEIDARFVQLVGYNLRHIHLNSVVWKEVIDNTQVKALAGTATQPFEYIRGNNETTTFVAELRGLPGVLWHINNNGVELNGTFTKLFPDTAAAFTVDPTSEIVSSIEYWEPVSEGKGDDPQPRGAEHYYVKPVDDPAGYWLHSLYNGIPFLKIPSGLAFGTVIS